MKLLVLFGFIFIVGWLESSTKKPSGKSTQKTIALEDTIHFTGGKMYERMPFDKDSTIINHETGILKRIKGEENLLIKTFIEQNKIN